MNTGLSLGIITTWQSLHGSPVATEHMKTLKSSLRLKAANHEPTRATLHTVDRPSSRARVSAPHRTCQVISPNCAAPRRPSSVTPSGGSRDGGGGGGRRNRAPLFPSTPCVCRTPQRGTFGSRRRLCRTLIWQTKSRSSAQSPEDQAWPE